MASNKDIIDSSEVEIKNARLYDNNQPVEQGVLDQALVRLLGSDIGSRKLQDLWERLSRVSGSFRTHQPAYEDFSQWIL
jgi:hypothetical protein